MVGWCATLIVALSIACSSPPSAVDRERLAKLKQQYGQELDFAFDGDLYLRAVSRDTMVPSQSDMEEVYRTFMFDESQARRRPTTFVYLNVYDARRDFQYQLAFDPRANRFLVSRTEHY